ncbi:MAG TPA: acyltransferase [Allosphingosinicella sp.]|jgi:peptidoglycan/LPS O-acetylase OafA/YrhL
MQRERLAYIDALRGYAILLVIFTHSAHVAGVSGFARHLADFGGRGVQLFFLVSAFTIFLTFEQARAREQRPVENFFIRRLVRIVPIYWLGILLYSLLFTIAPRPDFPLTPWHFPFHLTLTNSWVPGAASSVVPGGWSISVEVMFYLTTPLWFALVGSLRGAVVFTIAAILLGGAVAAVGRGLFPHLGEQYWFEMFPSQLACFGFGMILFHLVRDRRACGALVRPRVNLVILAASAALVVLELLRPLPFVPPHYVITFAFLLAASALSQIPWRLIVNGGALFMGRISYSAYLLHFLALAAAYSLVPEGLRLSARVLALFLTSLALTIPMAWLSFRFVERGFTALGRRWIERREATPVDPRETKAASGL